MYDSYDLFRLPLASVMASGKGSGPALPKDLPDGISAEDRDALILFALSMCAADDAEYGRIAQEHGLARTTAETSFGSSPARDRADLSYTFTGSFWKELFRASDHEALQDACRLISGAVMSFYPLCGLGPEEVLKRFHGFYTEMIRKKEDFLSRSYGEAEFTAMDLGLCAWDVLGDEDIERYSSEGWETGRIQNDITQRKLSRETEALDAAIGKLPVGAFGPADSRDSLIAVLLFDSLRTARCPESDKAQAFLALSSSCGLREITDTESWYSFRDNRTQFAADSFLMIHDVLDEDRFWKSMIHTEREKDMLLPLSTEVLRCVHGLMSAFEAYTLCEEHYMPTGFSAGEYMESLEDRLEKRLLGRAQDN